MSTADRFPYSSAPIKRVKAVQFCVWDPDEIVSTTSLRACMHAATALLGIFLAFPSSHAMRAMRAHVPPLRGAIPSPRLTAATPMRRASRSRAVFQTCAWAPWTRLGGWCAPPMVPTPSTAQVTSATSSWPRCGKGSAMHGAAGWAWHAWHVACLVGDWVAWQQG